MERLLIIFSNLLIATVVLTVPAHAGQQLESYFFPGPELQLQTRWLVPHLRPNVDPQLSSMTVVESPFTELRLVIPSMYVGKRVRVHAVLPAVAQGVEGSRGLEIEWRTQGVFQPGKLHMGERVPFFEGVAKGPLLSDRIAVIVRADARHISGPVRFETVYEIEEIP